MIDTSLLDEKTKLFLIGIFLGIASLPFHKQLFGKESPFLIVSAISVLWPILAFYIALEAAKLFFWRWVEYASNGRYRSPER